MGGLIVNPQTQTEDVAGLIGETENAVLDRFNQATDLSEGMLATASEFLTQLSSAAGSLGPFNPIIPNIFPAPVSLNFNPGDLPDEPESTELYLPNFPVEPVLQAIGLVTAIKARLEYDLANGVTGLDPDVEDDIWRRGQERDRIALDEAKEKIAAEWSKRGFNLPDGVLTAQLTQAETEYMNKRLDTSRDITIKQAEMAFQHTQFIIQQIIAMETLLINAVVEGNRTLIQEYIANMDGYKAQVQAAIEKLTTNIRIYEATVNAFRAKAEAQAAIAHVDIAAADAQIRTAVAQMEMYVREAEIMTKNAQIAAQLRVSAAEAGGRIAASIAAGMFAGISVQAHIGANAQIGKSYTGHETLSEEYRFDKTNPT